MHEGSGLERLARRKLRHADGGEFAQLLVNEREQLLRSLRVAFENERDFAHAATITTYLCRETA